MTTALAPRFGKLARPLAAVGLILAAYHYSLGTLLRGMALDTPLAYLGLVPLMAILIALARPLPPDEVHIHDRQLDYIIGLVLTGLALAIHVLVSLRLSVMLWVWRLDLVSLPLFAAGVLVLAFGVRVAWRQRVAVAFLFLAWPLPYVVALNAGLRRITNLTIGGLKALLRVIPIATPLPQGDGSVFSVPHGSQAILLSVASACSGVNGLVGFLLVGLAFQTVVRGSRKARILWLGAGCCLVWLFNVIRIMVVFAAAARWGERVALNWFHPYVGLGFFCLAVGCMVLGLRRFGLSWAIPDPARPGGGGAPAYRPRPRLALGILTVIALGLAALNADLRQAEAVANALGEPRLTAFEKGQATPPGWRRTHVEDYGWAKRFFGGDSTWSRYLYATDGAGGPDSPVPIVTDVISTSDLSALSAYGVEACYRFHGYEIVQPRRVELGSGLAGGLVTWTNPDDDSVWTTLYWQWPVQASTGMRYERVALLVDSRAGIHWGASRPQERSVAAASSSSLARALEAPRGGRRLTPEEIEARDAVVAFGRRLVAGRVAA